MVRLGSHPGNPEHTSNLKILKLIISAAVYFAFKIIYSQVLEIRLWAPLVMVAMIVPTTTIETVRAILLDNHRNSMGYPSWRWKITGIERSRKWHKWSDVCMRPQERSTEQPSWAQSTESWQINSPLNFEIVYLFFFFKTIDTAVSLDPDLLPI